MKILISNDDGFQAKGLVALYDAVKALPGVEVEVVGTSGVHLGPGLYLGFDGRKHGSWHGPLTIDVAAVLENAARRRVLRHYAGPPA